MSNEQPTPSPGGSVHAEGFRVSIPADVIASALATGTPSSSDAIQINLGGMQLTVPATLVQTLAQSMVPNHTVTIAFADGAIRVQMDNLPALRFELPAEGVTVKADTSGLRIEGASVPR